MIMFRNKLTGNFFMYNEDWDYRVKLPNETQSSPIRQMTSGLSYVIGCSNWEEVI